MRENEASTEPLWQRSDWPWSAVLAPAKVQTGKDGNINRKMSDNSPDFLQ